MAFPEDPLGLRIDIKAGTWTDITADCLTSEAIKQTRGIRNEGSTADAASVPLRINNADGKYSPRKPASPYYGLIGRNTPVRLWLPGGPHFLDMDGDPANTASTPDDAALDITGDIDLRWEGEANWYGPGAQVLLGKWGEAGNRSYQLRLQDGNLVIHTSTDGTIGPISGRLLPDNMPTRAAVRGVLDVADADGKTAAYLYWAPTMDGPWTQVGSTGHFADSYPIYAGTAPLTIAPDEPTSSPPRTPVEGRVSRIEVRAGIDGTVVANPDFTAQPVGATPFTDTAGRTWSFTGQAAIADRQDIFCGEIAEWPQKWVPSGALIWTDVQATGILRRLGQGVKPLDSTLRRRIPSANPDAYWPFEEDRYATRAYSPIPGVQPAAVTGVEWAAVTTLPSSQALPRLTAAATLSAIVPSGNSGAWQVEMVYNADDKAPPADGALAELLNISSTGTIRRWQISIRKDIFRVVGYNAAGTAAVSHDITTGGEDIFHGWYRLRFYVQDLGGGTVEWVVGWTNVVGSILQFGTTFSGSTGRVTAVTANWGALTEGWSIGHLAVMPTAANTIYDGSDSAYAGETAWTRMRRLATEENIPIARIAGELPTQRVGAQTSETLVGLLQAAADADGGMLLEDRRRPGLIYRDRSSLYSQEPALTLVYGEPGLSPPLDPVDDDTATRNDITVSREGGSSGRAVLDVGPLSVQQPPDGIGLYDEAVTLSLADDTQPEPIAYWRLHLGTYDGARYPSVRVLLHKAPHLIPDVLALREGDIIRLTGLPPWVAYGDVDLMVTGWTETLLPRTWEIVFTCLPGGPWSVATVNTLGEDFADDTYDLTLTDGGTLPWTRTTAHARTGLYSLRSGAITNNQTSDVTLTVPDGATSLSFWYRTSSEASGPGYEGDRLTVLADGVQVLRAQGETDWTIHRLDVTGVDEVLFRYAKDNSAGAGEDAVYIDDLRIRVGSYLPIKAGTDGTELADDVDATTTTVPILVTAGPQWTTDPTEMPIRITVGGEDMDVTAVTDPYEGGQELTVTRSVNGVVKAHTAGAPVALTRAAPAPL